MSYKVYNLNNRQTPNLTDRIICASTYLTGGLTGFIWLVINMLQRKNPSNFNMYHVSQAIFLYLFLYIVSICANLIYGLLQNVPFVGDLLTNILQFFLTPIYFGFSIVYGFIFLIAIYLAIFALLGKYSYIPFISDIINTNLGR